MKGFSILVGLWLLLNLSAFCRADAVDDLAKENAKLRQKVENMENELSELKKMVIQQGKVLQAKPKPVVKPELSEAEIQKILAMATQEAAKKKPVWSNLDIQLYGYIKLDAAYDDSRMNNGNFADWVTSERYNADDEEFNMTARQTRLGMNITGPEDGGLKTSGRVEIDFYEGGLENKNRIMMRHAYMKLDWPEDRFNIIAGQTSDVISPLLPSTLNYTVLWWAGNPGYRRPQVRLTKSFALDSDVDLQLEGALARTIGNSSTAFTPGDAGEDAGLPGVQSRASITFPLLDYKPTTLGVSGHWAKEELDTTAMGDHKHFDSWSLNLDLAQPVNEWLTVKGELFTGENLSAYLAGIGQGVNINMGTNTYKEIGSKGGWAAATLGPWDRWSFNVGAGVDNVDSDDVALGSRTLNRAIFGNVMYALNKNTKVGFELSHWRTEYKGSGDADNLRGQASFIYSF